MFDGGGIMERKPIVIDPRGCQAMNSMAQPKWNLWEQKLQEWRGRKRRLLFRLCKQK
jgi:hypothetical protein